MTDEELRTLVASLAVSTTGNAEAIRELRETLRENTESQARNAESQARNAESQARNAESQARSIEALREGMSYNTEIMTNALELSALSQKTAAEALQLSANTSRNLDRLESDIADLKQIVGIVIRDNQADRARITRLEDEE
jgi:CO dehydrogenase/acetyl-CoA synthase alpha subunit